MGKPNADIEVSDQGTVVGFTGLSDAGTQWITEHLPDDTRMGATVWADRRCARDIVDGIIEQGLELS